MLELHNISPITTNDNDIVTVCPLWHMKQNGKSDCVNNVIGNIKCNKGSLTVEESHCITWDNDTESIRITHCLFAPINSEVCSNGSCYSLSAKVSDPELNKQVCGMFSRQGTQCKQCISGYGHAAFSDGVSCADCSKHRYMWVLNLLLQLIFLTFLFLVITILQIKGTTCPLNIIITYSQLIINAVMDDSFYVLK